MYVEIEVGRLREYGWMEEWKEKERGGWVEGVRERRINEFVE
jgi:hypothetical protein